MRYYGLRLAMLLDSNHRFFDIENDLPLLRVPRLAKAIRASFGRRN